MGLFCILLDSISGVPYAKSLAIDDRSNKSLFSTCAVTFLLLGIGEGSGVMEGLFILVRAGLTGMPPS